MPKIALIQDGTEVARQWVADVAASFERSCALLSESDVEEYSLRVFTDEAVGSLLDGVDVAVGPRTRLGVVGPNGVGKTTLLRLLAGLDQPDRGGVTTTPPELRVGYLAQEPERSETETVLEALGRRTGVTAAEWTLESAAVDLAEQRPGAAACASCPMAARRAATAPSRSATGAARRPHASWCLPTRAGSAARRLRTPILATVPAAPPEREFVWPHSGLDPTSTCRHGHFSAGAQPRLTPPAPSAQNTAPHTSLPR